MKYIKSFNESHQQWLKDYGEHHAFPTDEESIKKILIRLWIKTGHPVKGLHNYQINPDGSVDCFGDVVYNNYYDLEGHFAVKFNYIRGNFQLEDDNITSLIGGPRIVDGNYIIDSRKITSLEGAPNEVRGMFSCRSTLITDLRGAPERVGNFDAKHNHRLISLEGLPKFVQERIDFEDCPKLWYPTDLKDCQIGRNFGVSEFKYSPLSMLQWTFGGLKELQESLDYNYLKPPMIWCGEKYPVIDLFRFKEALDEFEIKIEFVMHAGQRRMIIESGSKRSWFFPENIGRYIFVNESGERVDIDGQIVDPKDHLTLSRRP